MGRERRRSRRGTGREDFSPSEVEKDLLRRAPFVTDEEDTRDIWITDLLGIYVDAYEEKMERNRDYRSYILWTCVSIIVLLAIVLALLPFQVLEGNGGMKMGDVVSFITAIGSFLALIVGMLHVITEYVFPKDDEKYITEIVKAIQENDLKNRKVTARYRRAGGGHADQDLDRLVAEPMAPDGGSLTGK